MFINKSRVVNCHANEKHIWENKIWFFDPDNHCMLPEEVLIIT